MTIQEALRSGKRFRRKGCQWGSKLDTVRYTLAQGYHSFFALSEEDILATDWELETVKKELSAEDIRKAFEYSIVKADPSVYGGFIDCLLKHLGLE
jgi:hypothetical protein